MNDMSLNNIVGRCRIWLNNKCFDGLQRYASYRLPIFLYNFGDLQKYFVYQEYYGKDNPIKKGKEDIASDACIQFILFLISLDIDVQKAFEMGLEKIENMEFEKKKERKNDEN